MIIEKLPFTAWELAVLATGAKLWAKQGMMDSSKAAALKLAKRLDHADPGTETYWTFEYADLGLIRDDPSSAADTGSRVLFLNAQAAKTAAENELKEVTDDENAFFEWYELNDTNLSGFYDDGGRGHRAFVHTVSLNN